MTLQSSGPISLGNIQTEFGGANPIALSEYYAGGSYVGSGTTGINGAIPSSGLISVSKFYGSPAVLDTQTVTVGAIDTTGFGPFVYGYSDLFACGSIADGTSNLYSGESILQLAWYDTFELIFAFSTSVSNSGWTTMTINSTPFNRTDASFNGTYWSWASGTNPFGAIDSNAIVTWI